MSEPRAVTFKDVGENADAWEKINKLTGAGAPTHTDIDLTEASESVRAGVDKVLAEVADAKKPKK